MKNLLVLVVVLFAVLLPADAQGYMFKHLEVRDGLSNNQVNAIYKDSEGYMWFATASGLNRYDGYGIKVYRNEPNDSTSLPDNFISSIQEDGEGYLWIRTGKGYARYNPATETFSRRMDTWMHRAGIGDELPYLIYIDSDKTFWIYQSDAGRLYRYAPTAGKAVPVAETFGGRGKEVLASFAEYGDELLLGIEICEITSCTKESIALLYGHINDLA